MSGFSEAYSAKVLEHVTGKKETAPPTTYLALTTVVPTATSTGATLTEASYTGYARKEVGAAGWKSATAGVPSVIKNNGGFTFNACTAGSSKIVGWALCDKSGTNEGNIIMWGTTSSTEISTTQTPASIANEVLVLELK